MGLKDYLIEMFNAALEGVNPYRAVVQNMPFVQKAFSDGGFKKLFLAGFGKASCEMARAATASLDDAIGKGVVITKYGHSCSLPSRIALYEAGHPVPDENGLSATRKITDMIKKERGTENFFLCPISGGGSALLVSPYNGITLQDARAMTDLLLKAGADIKELNCVRKHISAVKGGRLAEMASPSKIITLIISDVLGDRIDMIASGPTAPDPTTYQEALNVLKKYDLLTKTPVNIVNVLNKGAEGNYPETPKENDPIFRRVQNIIIADNKMALEGAFKMAQKLGFNVRITSGSISGEARIAGAELASSAKKLQARGEGLPLCLISGGETTVKVKGKGKGGRNMELALAFAKEIAGTKGISLLSAGTDGTDGPTDAAGAIVDGNTIPGAISAGLSPDNFLEKNDSYNFFNQAGGLFVTGPTGTNVMDIQIIAIT